MLNLLDCSYESNYEENYYRNNVSKTTNFGVWETINYYAGRTA
jgi:hypothetical protein